MDSNFEERRALSVDASKAGQTDGSANGSHSDERRSEGGASGPSYPQAFVADRLKFHAALGIGCGILLMFVGGGISQRADATALLSGLVVVALGWAWELWGCVSYMRWKGHSGWFGLLGYFLLPGLLILVCFPNRRKRFVEEGSGDRIAAAEKMSLADQRPAYRFLLVLAPLGLLFACVAGGLLWASADVDPAKWEHVAVPGSGFEALMPAKPEVVEQTQETPAGKAEMCKFSARPKGDKELFMIVSIHFPADVGRDVGGPETLLEAGRQDVLSASQGEIKSEHRITLDGCPGLEMEVARAKGGVVKARVYATKEHLLEVLVGVAPIRLGSKDVQKFFDSFKLSAESSARAD